MKRNLLKKKIKDLAFELTGKKSGIRYWGRTRHTGWYFLVLFVCFSRRIPFSFAASVLSLPRAECQGPTPMGNVSSGSNNLRYQKDWGMVIPPLQVKKTSEGNLENQGGDCIPRG